MWFILALSILGGALVPAVDAGAVADKPNDLRARVGVGAGIRYNSPVGPLQADLAYGVTPKRLRLHLTVGFTF